MNPYLMTRTEFGEYLRTTRLESKYGLRQFAALIGMPASSYCDVEQGRRLLENHHWPVVACVLGLPLTLHSKVQ